MRTLQLTQVPQGPLDVLRRVMTGRTHSDGLLLVCTHGKPALLLRFGPGDDAETLIAAANIAPGLLDVLIVQHGRWRSLLCRDAACCPTEGRLLPESSPTGRFNP